MADDKTSSIDQDESCELSQYVWFPRKNRFERMSPAVFFSAHKISHRRADGTSNTDQHESTTLSRVVPLPVPDSPQIIIHRGGDSGTSSTDQLSPISRRREDYGTSSTDQQIKNESHEVSLDIDELAESVKKHSEIKYAFSKACCIYRVPERLRHLNRKAYTPRVVSLGPIHRGKENLKAMEDHKKVYLQQFLEQSNVSVEDLINIIKKNETKLRDCYAETVQLSRKEFTTMILMDAVFIIVVLLNWKYAEEYLKSGHSDHIFFRPWKFVDVLFDMCLLENQLPFFILEKLFELSSVDANPEKCTILELTSWSLKDHRVEWVKEDSWKKINSSEVLHFVDFLRKCQQPTPPAKQEAVSAPTAKQEAVSAPTATELHQAGVKFVQAPSERLLFEVEFSKGILKVPQLKIQDSTEVLFRNLQAFEQCHAMDEDTFVSDYITLISCLVNAPNDVEVLVHNGILNNMLRSNQAVSNLFYELAKENFTSRDAFYSVSKDLNKYCGKHRHKWKASLKQVYFNNPWTGISVLAVGFLLILTVIQTVCSILQVD